MNIYGVDSEGIVTPKMVRDALDQCFYEAHCQDADVGIVGDPVNKDYCLAVVRKAFSDTGGDFENPTKQSIEKAVNKLVEFSKNFRDPSLVTRHAAEIGELIKRLE